MSVPKDTKSTQYKIWNNTFLCQMKNIDTMSIDYLRIFGTLTSGDPSLDNQMNNEIVLRRLTIIQMIKYFNEGINVSIKNPKDSKTIYILLQEHLENWADHTKHALRKDAIPVEELQIMDRFANAVYEHAKWYLDTALADTPFARALRKDKRSVLNMLKPVEEEVKGESTILRPTRQSMSDVFSQGLPFTPKPLEKRF